MIRFRIFAVELFLLIFLFPGSNAANILGIFPIGAKSHFIYNRSIMESLHKAGHNITIICSFEESESVQNFTTISMPFVSLESTSQGSVESFVQLGLAEYLKTALSILKETCDIFLASKYVQHVLNLPKIEFDVLIVEYVFLDCFTVIAEKFDLPIILTNSITAAAYVDILFGNPYHPAVIPSGFVYTPPRMNFLQRLENTANYIYLTYLFRTVIDSPMIKYRQRIQNEFGIEFKNTYSLLLQNTHSSFLARPMAPNVIGIGGIHLKSNERLPQNIQKFLDESATGVILFTFGSITRGSFLSSRTVAVFKEVFSQIPQRIIWKYEETIEDLPKNVMISSWVPQRDILAHKNIVAFITHCGLGGIYEAIYESVPLVMIPFANDQLMNAANLEEKGVGVVLDPLRLSNETIRKALDLVVNETSYRENMRELSLRFKDRPMTPQESVVYWTNYVISHRGALHLRSYWADIPYYQFFFLDTLLVVVVILLLSYILVRSFVSLCIHKTIKYDKKKKQN